MACLDLGKQHSQKGLSKQGRAFASVLTSGKSIEELIITMRSSMKNFRIDSMNLRLRSSAAARTSSWKMASGNNLNAAKNEQMQKDPMPERKCTFSTYPLTSFGAGSRTEITIWLLAQCQSPDSSSRVIGNSFSVLMSTSYNYSMPTPSTANRYWCTCAFWKFHSQNAQSWRNFSLSVLDITAAHVKVARWFLHVLSL